MLQQIAHIIIISIIAFVWGIPGLLILKRNSSEDTENFWIRSTLGLYCFLYFSGLILLSFITSLICLFIPLKFSYLLIISIGLTLLLCQKKAHICIIVKKYSLKGNLSLVEFVFGALCITIFVLVGTLEPVNSDTKIYHIQIIKWNNEYGTIPGIANLYPRYGLGSNWFNLIAIFKIPFLNNNYTWLNTTTVIWFFLYLFSNWKYHQKKASISPSNQILGNLIFGILIFFLLEWELFRDAANSTNYDFIVTAVTIVIILYLIEEIFLPTSGKQFSFYIPVLCISLIPFKLSGALSMILLVYYLYTFNKLKYWFVSFLTGILIITPFLVKNYITTGYLLFPVANSIYTPDWQLPVAMTDYLRQFIHVTNRNYNTGIDYTHIPELMHKSWIKSWFNGILIQHKLIIIGTFSSILLFIVKPKISINIKKLRLLFLSLFLIALSWFISAPSPRFGYGVLLVLAFFPACFYISMYIPTTVYKHALILLIAFGGFYLVKRLQPILDNPIHFISTTPLYNIGFTTVNQNGIQINIPIDSGSGWYRDCIDTKLPCACQENVYVYPRGKSVKSGFRFIGKPDSSFVRNYVY